MSKQLTKDRVKIPYTDSQGAILSRHRRRLVQLCSTIQAALANDPTWSGVPTRERRYPPVWLKQPRQPLALAVMGPRGAGKTTLLADLLHDKDERPDWCTLENEWKSWMTVCKDWRPITEIIDCSLCPSEIPLGFAILQQLRAALKLDHHTADAGLLLRDERKAWRAVEDCYLSGHPLAWKVLESTAMATAHFSHEAGQLSQKRYGLPMRVADWLEAAAKSVKVTGFIVGLDDIDLAQRPNTDHSPGQIINFIYSLLDELHQPRLLLVLAADEIRLEEQVAGVGEGDEVGKTAHALIAKVLPQSAREYLRPWSEADRLGFVPPTQSNKKEKSTTLREALHKHCKSRNWDAIMRHPKLLPEWPRALENLLRVLHPGDSASKDQHRLHLRREYLAFLAYGRNRVALGRQLVDEDVLRVGRSIPFPEKHLDRDEWSALVLATLNGRSLKQLVPTSSPLSLSPERLEDGIWLELLVDLAMKEGHLSPLEVIQRIPSLRERLQRTNIQRELRYEPLNNELTQAREGLEALFAWTVLQPRFDERNNLSPEIPVQVGWSFFLEVAQGRRDVWPEALVQGSRLSVRRKLSPYRNHHAYSGWHPRSLNPEPRREDIVPRRLRALILLLDALDRAPWELLSQEGRRRSLAELAQRTAGLVRAAYLFALERVFEGLQKNGLVKEGSRFKVERGTADHYFLSALRLGGGRDTRDWWGEDAAEKFQALVWPAGVEPSLDALKTPGAIPESQNLPRSLLEEDLPDDAGPLAQDHAFNFATYNELVASLHALCVSPWFRMLASPSLLEER